MLATFFSDDYFRHENLDSFPHPFHGLNRRHLHRPADREASSEDRPHECSVTHRSLLLSHLWRHPFRNMTTPKAQTDLQAARAIAIDTYGENPPPEIVAAVLNSLTAQHLAEQLDETAQKLANQIYQNSGR